MANPKNYPPSKVSGKMRSQGIGKVPKAPIPKPKFPAPAPANPKRIK